MHILCLQQSSIFENYGGVEYYLHDLLTLASNLLGKDSVTSLIPDRGKLNFLSPTDYEAITVPFKASGFFKKIENRVSPSLFREALRVAREKKTTLILAGHVSLSPLAYALSKALGIPFWTVAYGLDVWGGLSLPTEWAFRQSNAVLSISHWTKSILVSRGFNEEKIKIVHPALQASFENAIPKIFDLDSRKPLQLLTISRLDAEEQYKGHDHVIAALQIIKKKRPSALPQYTIQGHGTDKDRLEQLVFYAGLGDNVTFIDKLESREKLKHLYQECDLFVMPSRFGSWEGKWRGEGFGIVYLEAAAFGVPTLAYQCGGVIDIVENEKTGILVKPDDIQALANAILDLNDNRQKLSLLGANAQKRANEHFSLSAISKELQTALGLNIQSFTEVGPDSDSIDVSQVLNPIS